MSNLTPAQQRQQSNRTSDGKYTTKQHAEADVDLGLEITEHNPDAITLDYGDVHSIDLDELGARTNDEIYGDNAYSQPISSAYLTFDGDNYVISATAHRDFHDAMPDEYEHAYDPEQIEDYLAQRQDIIDRHVSDWHGEGQVTRLDDGYEFSHVLGADATTEQEAIESLRDNTKVMGFSEDEDLASDIRAALRDHDAQKLPNPEEVNRDRQRMFAHRFADKLLSQLQEDVEDEGYTDDDGNPVEVFYADGTEHQVIAFASEFYENNEGDIINSGHPGVTDVVDAAVGISTQSLEYDGGSAGMQAHNLESEVVYNRLDNSVETELPEFSLSSGNVEVSDDGQGRYGKIQLHKDVVDDLKQRMDKALGR